MKANNAIVRVLAAAILSITSLTFIGYAVDAAWMLNWGKGPQMMAFNTATCFFLTGLSLFMLSKNRK